MSSSFPNALHHAFRELNKRSAWKIGPGIYAIPCLPNHTLIFCNSLTKWKKARGKKEVHRTMGFCAHTTTLRVYSFVPKRGSDISAQLEQIRTCMEGGTLFKKPTKISVRKKR